MTTQVLKPFSQPRHNTAVEVNKESIARNYGVNTDAVGYARVGMSLDGIQVLYDTDLQRSYPLPAGVVGGAVVTSYSAGQLAFASGNTVKVIDLNELCVQRGLWFILYGYDFSSGATLQYANDVLEYFDESIKAFSYYRWGGALPKVVSMDSDPLHDDNWIVVGTQAISSALSGPTGASQVGFGTTNVSATLQDLQKRMTVMEEYPEQIEVLAANSGDHTNRLVTLENYKTGLSGADGFKNIGWVASVAALRKIEPIADGQLIRVRAWEAGSVFGGGWFVYDASATTNADDGGYYIVTAGGKRWRREVKVSELTILDFGGRALPTFDNMPAILRMHNFMQAQLATYNMGVRIPAGSYGLGSTINLGTAEIGAFHLSGERANYGVIPATNLVPILNNPSAAFFTMNARRMEVSNIRLLSTSDNVTPFYKNICTGGQYVNVRCFVANNHAGRIFDLLDTIDCLFEQVYAYRIKAAFAYSIWSNRVDGYWDHSTAIEIRNANFSACTGKYTLYLPRCGQSMMRNVWFQNCEWPFDISQGGWTLDNVSMEGCTNKGNTRYAKLLILNMNVQGNGLDDTVTDTDPAWDKTGFNNGNYPSWVTSAYQRGFVQIQPSAQQRIGGAAEHFKYSNLLINNATNQTTWFCIGSFASQGHAHGFKLRIIGTSGWNSAVNTIYRPDQSNYGGGEAIIRAQIKANSAATTSLGEVSWYGEGACPIKAVKYVHYYNTITIYVQMQQYAYYGAVFVETDGTSRLEKGIPFYVTPNLASISDADIAAVANIRDATSQWSINGGVQSGSGLGMNLDTGDLLLYAPNTPNSEVFSIMLNGNQRYIRTSTRDYAQTFARFTRANLPNVNDGVYTVAFVTDAPYTPSLQLVASNGYGWYYVTDNTLVSRT